MDIEGLQELINEWVKSVEPDYYGDNYDLEQNLKGMIEQISRNIEVNISGMPNLNVESLIQVAKENQLENVRKAATMWLMKLCQPVNLINADIVRTIIEDQDLDATFLSRRMSFNLRKDVGVDVEKVIKPYFDKMQNMANNIYAEASSYDEELWVDKERLDSIIDLARKLSKFIQENANSNMPRNNFLKVDKLIEAARDKDENESEVNYTTNSEMAQEALIDLCKFPNIVSPEDVIKILNDKEIGINDVKRGYILNLRPDVSALLQQEKQESGLPKSDLEEPEELPKSDLEEQDGLDKLTPDTETIINGLSGPSLDGAIAKYEKLNRLLEEENAQLRGENNQSKDMGDAEKRKHLRYLLELYKELEMIHEELLKKGADRE